MASVKRAEPWAGASADLHREHKADRKGIVRALRSGYLKEEHTA